MRDGLIEGEPTELSGDIVEVIVRGWDCFRPGELGTGCGRKTFNGLEEEFDAGVELPKVMLDPQPGGVFMPGEQMAGMDLGALGPDELGAGVTPVTLVAFTP